MTGQVSVGLVSLLTEHRTNPTESLSKAHKLRQQVSTSCNFGRCLPSVRYLVNLSIRRPTAKLPKRKPNEEIIMMKDISPTLAPTKSLRKICDILLFKNNNKNITNQLRTVTVCK
jgi:hypothetical protein